MKDFETKLLEFQETTLSLKRKVVNAAIARNASGKPALDQQQVKEQLDHLQKHLDNVLLGNKGDEDSVTEQLLHLCCRSLLALYAWQQQHNLTSEELFNGEFRP